MGRCLGLYGNLLALHSLPPAGRPGDEETYYDSVKKELAARAAATRSLLDSLDPATRQAMEGLRPGTYVRLRFSGKPLAAGGYNGNTEVNWVQPQAAKFT